MADPIDRIGEFSEQGRGVPVALSRPGGALPFSPLTRQAYAPAPIARIGWAQGLIRCGELPLEPAEAVEPTALISSVARLLADRGGFVPVVERGRFLGVVYVDRLLEAVADKLDPPTVARLVSPQIPTCSPRSALVDAVRAMLACYLRKIPVVGDRGGLVGLLSLSAAAAAGERDPAVRDVIEASLGPALFARPWR